jgi:hypothetical protein
MKSNMNVHRRDVETRKKKVGCRSQVSMGHFMGTAELIHRSLVAFRGWYHVLRCMYV